MRKLIKKRFSHLFHPRNNGHVSVMAQIMLPATTQICVETKLKGCEFKGSYLQNLP
jgi:hypothetical protein